MIDTLKYTKYTNLNIVVDKTFIERNISKYF